MDDAEPDGAPERAELSVFTSKEAYVYRIPPASTTGHRADTWGVDDWLQARAMLALAPVFPTVSSPTWPA